MPRQDEIVKMFDDIAPTYDIANRALSFGLDVSWRKKACDMTLGDLQNRSVTIVDVACGTGDMMSFWEKCAPKFGVKIERLIGVDPSGGMLEVARKKFPNFHFIQASATDTTLDGGGAQILSISYGIRNVVELDAALCEFSRVLDMGGYLVVLEFTKTDKRNLMTVARDIYLKKILPTFGGIISKKKAAYEYLPNSIETFLHKEAFIQKLQKFGFEIVTTRGFVFDVTTLFIAKKVKAC